MPTQDRRTPSSRLRRPQRLTERAANGAVSYISCVIDLRTTDRWLPLTSFFSEVTKTSPYHDGFAGWAG
jgi:hypothetical protein